MSRTGTAGGGRIVTRLKRPWTFTGPRRAITMGLGGLMVLLLAAGVAAAARNPAHTAAQRGASHQGMSTVLIDVSFIDAEHGWIAGQAGYVLRTSDGGATWTKTTMSGRVNLNSVSFADSTHGFASGNWWTSEELGKAGPLLFSTSDGGATWEKSRVLPSVNGEMDHVVAIDADTACAVGATSEIEHYGVVVRTTNGGSSWQTQLKQSGRKTTVLTGVDFIDADTGWASGYGAHTGHGVVLATSDGGATWRRQPAPQSGWLLQICFVDAERGWASADKSVLRTTDGGATWTKIAVVHGRDKDLEDIFFVDAEHGWAVGNSGAIWATSDGGVTWTAQKSGVKTGLLAVCFVSAQQGWVVGEDNVVLKTADGGTTWVNGR